jgi:DNA-binding GntR family transcriptional regulator
MKADSGLDTDLVQGLIDESADQFGTAQELILNVVRRAIMDGMFRPETRLRQEHLAKFFRTSRIPVREALRVLEHEGLVTSEPHRGFVVTALDADQIDEIYELRVVLESHAVRQAIPLLTDQDLQELEAIHSQMEATSDPDERLQKREQLYLRLYSVTARPRLVGLIARLHQEVGRSLRWKQVQYSPAQHQAFFDAVRRGDADAAVAELTHHYNKVAALIRRFVRESNQTKDGNGRQPRRRRTALRP